MRASLYHSGSTWAFGGIAICGLEDSVTESLITNHKHVRDPLGRIELHVVPVAAPPVARAVEQVLDGIAGSRIDPHLPDRHLYPSLLRPVRVGVGDDKDPARGRTVSGRGRV